MMRLLAKEAATIDYNTNTDVYWLNVMQMDQLESGCQRYLCIGNHQSLRHSVHKYEYKVNFDFSDRIQQLEELSGLYSLPNIVRVVKSRRMRRAGHVARMG